MNEKILAYLGKEKKAREDFLAEAKIASDEADKARKLYEDAVAAFEKYEAKMGDVNDELAEIDELIEEVRKNQEKPLTSGEQTL